MTQVRFFDQARNEDLKFAVIAARMDGKWLLCRHKERATWEFPGGHREEGENIHDTARRELWEETGAHDFQLEPVSAYAVDTDGETSYGALFFAQVRELGERPAQFEIGENRLFDALPGELTYPEIIPALMDYIQRWLEEDNFRDEIDDIFELMV